MITVKELLAACQEQIDKDNGDKNILIWVGDKYVSLESLFFDRTDLLVSVKPGNMHEDDLRNSVILG